MDVTAKAEPKANITGSPNASAINPPIRGPMMPPMDHIQIVSKVWPVTHLSCGTISKTKVEDPVINDGHANGASNEYIKKSRRGLEVKTKRKKIKLYMAAEKISNGFLAPILSHSLPTRRKTGISNIAGTVKTRPKSTGEALDEFR